MKRDPHTAREISSKGLKTLGAEVRKLAEETVRDTLLLVWVTSPKFDIKSTGNENIRQWVRVGLTALPCLHRSHGGQWAHVSLTAWHRRHWQ